MRVCMQYHVHEPSLLTDTAGAPCPICNPTSKDKSQADALTSRGCSNSIIDDSTRGVNSRPAPNYFEGKTQPQMHFKFKFVDDMPEDQKHIDFNNSVVKTKKNLHRYRLARSLAFEKWATLPSTRVPVRALLAKNLGATLGTW